MPSFKGALKVVLVLVVLAKSGAAKPKGEPNQTDLPSQFAVYNLVAMFLDLFGKDCSYMSNFGSLDFTYGCYCGIGTDTNESAMDKTDGFCQQHDQCYSKVKPRKWWQTQKMCLFVLDHDYTIDPTTKKITCTDKKDSCQYDTCECDRIVLEQLYKQYKDTGKCPFKPDLKCPAKSNGIGQW